MVFGIQPCIKLKERSGQNAPVYRKLYSKNLRYIIATHKHTQKFSAHVKIFAAHNLILIPTSDDT